MKQNKKYALRKTAAYGLVSCAVGLMLVGSAPIQADESASSTDAISTVEDTQDTSRITDVLNGQVQGYIQASKPLTGNDFIVDSNVAADKLPAIEYYKTIFNQIPASYRRMVTRVQFIHAEDAILGDTSSSRVIKIRANYIHPDQKPDFSDGLDVMFHELGHVIDFASMQGSGDSLWSISRDPYMRGLLTSAYPNDQRPIYEIFASAFGDWLNYRVLGESKSNMQNLYNQFDSLFGDFIFNSPYNNDDTVTERTYKESTVFNWTGTFKSDKGVQLHDDAHLSAFYERVIHEANNSKTADQWTLVNRTSDHMEDLHLENHLFFGYGEPNTYSIGGNRFTIPGRIGDYYLASYDGNNMQHIGQNLWYAWQDHIYNEIGKQGVEVNRLSNFVYRQKDTKITLRLIDSEHPETVYHTVEVPAFTNYEHNGLDTHVFDSFKSEGELLDNLPNEVALANDEKTIDIRLKKKDVTGEVTFKDAFGREIHQAIAYQGKSQDKLSDETIEQMRQVLLANKETHPNVRITINNGSMPEQVYTDVDAFLNDISKFTFEANRSNIQVQYGVTVTKTYPFQVQSSFTRLLVPEGLESLAERHHSYEDGRRIRYTHDYYSSTDGKLYDAFLPYVSGQNEYDLYRNDGKVFMFLESVSSTDFDNLITYGLDGLGLDTSSAKINPTTTATYPLTLTMQIDPLGNVSVSNVEMGEVESDKPLSARFLPGFDTYYLGGGGISALLDSIYKHEVDVDSLKFDNTFNYQIGTQLSSEDITKLMNAFGDMGKLDENNEASLDNKINRVLDEYKYRVGIMIPWYAEKVTGEEAKEWLDGKHYMNSSPILLVTPKTYQNKVKIVNDAGEILAEKDLSAKYKDTVNYDMTDAFKALEDEYITSDDLSGNWTAATENQDIIIHAKERFIKNTETKQIKRIVRFHDGRNVVGEEEQVATFTRTVKKEVLTGELTYSDWTSERPQFDEIAVPTKEDKTANVQSVPEKAVTVEDKDEIVDVYYGPKMVDGDTQTKATIHVTYKYQDGTIYKEFDVQADKGSILDGSDLEMLPDNMNFTDEFTTYEVKGDGTDAIERTVKKDTSDSETQTKATIHVVYRNADGTIYKAFDVQADKGSILDGSDLEMLPDDMNFTDDFTTYEVKGDGTDNIERTVKKQTSDSETQTKTMIHVVYRNQDGTVYKEFDIQADKGSILDGSDLEMLPDDMNFTDGFTTYEVKGDGTDAIERTVKKQTSDNGSQTDNPTTSDGGTQTDNPDTSDSETQTKATIHVAYKYQDGTIYKEFDVQADKGSILDGSDLEMLPDDMDFTDEFTTYEVKGDGTDHIERSVKKQTSDSGSQTDNPDTSDGSTQTKTEIKVVYKNADGTVYKEFVVNADKGSILDASDLEMLSDDMEFNDDFMFYEVKGDGTDNIERIVKKVTSDQGSQTDNPDTSEGLTQTDNPDTSDGSTQTDTPDSKDNGTQTDNPDTSDGSTQTDTPDSKDNGTQTDNPDTSDGSTQTNTPDSKDNGTQTDNPDTSDGATQTKAEIKVVYKNVDGTVYKEFVVNADKGTILGASDLEMLPDDMEFNDDFMFYEVKGDGTDNIERIVKKVTPDQGSQTDNPDTSDGSTQTDEPNKSDGSTQTDTPDSKDNGTQTDKPDVSDKGSQVDKPDVKDDATQTDRPKDEPTQSIPKQNGISEVKPLSNKATSGYTRVQPTKSVGHLSNAGQLPKAGSTDNSKLGLIGAVFALLGGMIGFVSRRKVHK